MPITYKCPNCGAAMEFDSTAQKLKCPSCQMEMDVQDYEKQYGHLYSDAEAGENAQSAQSMIRLILMRRMRKCCGVGTFGVRLCHK